MPKAKDHEPPVSSNLTLAFSRDESCFVCFQNFIAPNKFSYLQTADDDNEAVSD